MPVAQAVYTEPHDTVLKVGANKAQAVYTEPHDTVLNVGANKYVVTFVCFT